MSLQTKLQALVDKIAEKNNKLYSLAEKKANKQTDLTSTNPDHYPNVPAVKAGLASTLADAKSYTDTEISELSGSVSTNYILKSEKGVANGVATLDASGLVPSNQLPSYVDDVLEFADLASFPVTGETAKIYVALNNNITYRWSGTGYVEISKSLALGTTSTTAFRGDHGQIAYAHTSLTNNPHNVTKAQVGLGNVDNTSDMNKPVSTAQQAAIDLVQDDADAIIAELNTYYKPNFGVDFSDYATQLENAVHVDLQGV